MEEIKKQIGNLIKLKLKDNFMTQKELADKLFEPYHVVNRICNGKKLPEGILLRNICFILKIDFEVKTVYWPINPILDGDDPKWI